MIDWNSDPGLKAIRQEFIDSLGGRLADLKKLREKKDINSLQSLAHKLAGAAESYGFPVLTRIAGALDDWIASDPSLHLSQTLLQQSLALLEEALSLGLAKRKDPEILGEDPRTKELTSFVESLLDLTKS